MEYQIQVHQVEPQTTAVVRCRAKQSELSKVVPEGCGEVWTYLRSTPLPKPGRHLALYLDCEINLEVGVEMPQPFTGSDRVVRSETPGGLVATTVHLAAYHRLGEAHRAICQWFTDNGHVLAGPSWEVYGHWTDDPATSHGCFLLVANGW